MILIDSCGWLEYFTEGPLAHKYSTYLEGSEEILVPLIVIYEVYKKIKRIYSEELALLAVGRMKTCRVEPLRESLVLLAADLGLKYHLPLADALVYAAATSEKATLITSDKHFRGLKHVKYLS